MSSIIILRGFSGVGKTTYAKSIMTKFSDVHLSTDDYFVHGGVYKFDPRMLETAHRTTLRKFIELCRNPNKSINIVVDNTNLSVVEYAPYASIGAAYGHYVEIVSILCDPTVAFARNQHNVPKETFDRMLTRFDQGTKDMPHFFKHRFVVPRD